VSSVTGARWSGSAPEGAEVASQCRRFVTEIGDP
jgi:hypothetical protein